MFEKFENCQFNRKSKVILFFLLLFYVTLVYVQVLLRMGFTHLELDNHFGGATFLAWFVLLV